MESAVIQEYRKPAEAENTFMDVIIFVTKQNI